MAAAAARRGRRAATAVVVWTRRCWRGCCRWGPLGRLFVARPLAPWGFALFCRPLLCYSGACNTKARLRPLAHARSPAHQARAHFRTPAALPPGAAAAPGPRAAAAAGAGGLPGRACQLLRRGGRGAPHIGGVRALRPPAGECCSCCLVGLRASRRTNCRSQFDGSAVALALGCQLAEGAVGSSLLPAHTPSGRCPAPPSCRQRARRCRHTCCSASAFCAP